MTNCVRGDSYLFTDCVWIIVLQTVSQNLIDKHTNVYMRRMLMDAAQDTVVVVMRTLGPLPSVCESSFERTHSLYLI